MNPFINKIKTAVSIRSTALVVCAIFCAATIGQYAAAAAVDYKFYVGNNILYYDPNACIPTPSTGGSSTGGPGGGTLPPLAGGDNIEKVFRYLVSKGQTAIGAAAITGNMIQESGLDPTITNSIGAFGIAQWYQGRRTALQSYEGSNYNTLNGQLDYLWHEGQTGEKTAWDTVKGASSLLGGSLPSGGSSGAVFKWEEIYEVAGEQIGDVPMNHRMANAQNVFDLAQKGNWGGSTGTVTGGGTSTGSGSTSANACSPGGSSTSLTNVNGCVNPFQLDSSNWGLARTDQGVDYIPSKQLPLHAICDGKVTFSSQSTGWPSGGYIAIKLTSGPPEVIGKCMYIAEHIINLVPVGTTVKAGQVIGQALPGYAWTEWGWSGDRDWPAIQYNGAADGTPMPGGKAFARFIRALGGKTLQDPGSGPIYDNSGTNCP